MLAKRWYFAAQHTTQSLNSIEQYPNFSFCIAASNCVHKIKNTTATLGYIIIKCLSEKANHCTDPLRFMSNLCYKVDSKVGVQRTTFHCKTLYSFVFAYYCVIVVYEVFDQLYLILCSCHHPEILDGLIKRVCFTCTVKCSC